MFKSCLEGFTTATTWLHTQAGMLGACLITHNAVVFLSLSYLKEAYHLSHAIKQANWHQWWTLYTRQTYPFPK